MAWANDPEILACENYGDNSGTFKTRHTYNKRKNEVEESHLFQTDDFLVTASDYSTNKPGAETGDSQLYQNPGLLAFKNKKSKLAKPTVISPATSLKKVVQSQRLITSLSSTKPIPNFRESYETSVEITNRQTQMEEMTLQFTEDPVAYFSKRKDGRGHKFIYLIFADDKSDPAFSPYNIRKVPSAEIGRDYFMMSASGVTHVHPEGESETVTLDQWAREESIFKSIRKLKTFAKYFYWQPFSIWRKFVMKQRYEELSEKVCKLALFKNPLFFSKEIDIRMTADIVHEIISKYLLVIAPGKMFTIPVYKKLLSEMRDELKSQYYRYITFNLVTQINEDLYKKVSDRQLAEVHDEDFWKGRKSGPNMLQLVNLEKKKATLRKEKTDEINRQIMSIGGLIRTVDYMTLRELMTAYIDAFGEASKVVDNLYSNVFRVDIHFNEDGSIGMTPEYSEWEDVVGHSLRFSEEFINSLPRVIHNIDLRPLLRDSGLDLSLLFSSTTSFKQILSSQTQHIVYINNILSKLKESFNSAREMIQSFAEYYEIHKSGDNWDVMKYVHTRMGKPYTGTISEAIRNNVPDDDFLVHSRDEPVVDFDKVRNDLRKFTVYLEKVQNIRAKNMKGVLYIDSTEFKENLLPIPKIALKDLKGILRSLASMKISLLENTFRNKGKALRADPMSLEDFVDLCSLIKQTNLTMPAINDEIVFINRALTILVEFGEKIENMTPIDKMLMTYQQEKATADETRKAKYQMFSNQVEAIIKEIETKLASIYTASCALPGSIEEAHPKEKMVEASKRKEEVTALKPQIETVLKYQEIMDLNISKLEFYDKVIQQIDFSIHLFRTLVDWERISTFAESSPFTEIDMPKFVETFTSILDSVKSLKSTRQIETPLLEQITSEIGLIEPSIPNMKMIAGVRMLRRHWETLYEECGFKEGYNPRVTIVGLQNMGLFKFTDIIEAVTATASAESEIEGEFEVLDKHWRDITIQFLETPVLNEDTMILAPIDKVILDIDNARIALHRISATQFSINIRDQVNDLISSLDMSEECLKAWALFQENRELISGLFVQEETRKLLPEKTELFHTVQQTWNSIAKHVLQDIHLFKACSYPRLAQIFFENNSIMEEIMISIDPLLEAKRVSCPRLFFISNTEQLLLMSTRIWSQFSSLLTKMFMNILKFDVKETIKDAAENISRVKLYGMIGNSGEILPFNKFVNVSWNSEILVNQITEQMQIAMKEAIPNNVSTFNSMAINEWVAQIPTHVAISAINVVTTRELDFCIKTFETNSKSPAEFDTAMAKRIATLVNTLASSQRKDIDKISTLIVHLSSIKDRGLDIFKEHKEDYQPELKFHSILKFRHVINTNEIAIDIGSGKWTFGNEFWGTVPRMVFTEEIERAYETLANSESLFGPTLINSGAGTGKTLLSLYSAAMFGRPAFVFSASPELCETFLKRMVVGAISSGSWAIFSEIDRMTTSQQSFVFDNTWFMNSMNNSPKVTIQGNHYQCNHDSRIIFTTSKNNSPITSQLKAFTRTLSFLPPDLIKFATIKMMASGFREAAELAPSIVSLIQSISSTFNLASSLSTLNKVIVFAKKYLKTTTETHALCVSAYSLLGPSCSNELLDSLIVANFPSLESISKFKDAFAKTAYDETRNKYKAIVEKEVQRQSIKLPIDEVTNKIMEISEMMDSYPCTIITGPINTGKTMMMNIYESVHDRQDFLKLYPSEKPVKIIPIYHASDAPQIVYGARIDEKFNFGIILSTITQSLKQQKEQRIIIKFDGPITPEFDKFMTGFLGSSDISHFSFGSLDTFIKNKKMGFIIETNDISKASPALLSRCAIVYTSKMPIKECALENPACVLSSAASLMVDTATPDLMKAVMPKFESFAPRIVQRIYSMPNLIASSNEPIFSRDATQYISTSLTKHAAIAVIHSLGNNKEKLKDEGFIDIVMAASFFCIFANILDGEERNELEKWLQMRNELPLPKDFIDGTPKDFIEEFKKPSLRSCVIDENGELSQLSSEPLNLTEEYVVTPQILPSIYLSFKLLGDRSNLLIYGNMGSGKSAFVRLLFSMNPNITPIFLQSSILMSSEKFGQFLSQNTPFATKKKTFNHKFVLVVEDVMADDVNIIETLRMINEMHQIKVCSPKDPKYSETVDLASFQIIITTSQLKKLPVRFVSKFSLVRLDPINDNSVMYICTQIMGRAGFTSIRAKSIIDFCFSVINHFNEKRASNKTMAIAKALSKTTDINKPEQYMNIAMSLLYQYALHKYNPADYVDTVNELAKAKLTLLFEKKAVAEFLKYQTIIVLERENGWLNAKEYAINEIEAKMRESVLKFERKIRYRFRGFPSSIRTLISFAFLVQNAGSHILLVGENELEKISYLRMFSEVYQIPFESVFGGTNHSELKEIARKAVLSAAAQKNFIIYVDSSIDETLIKSFSGPFGFVNFFTHEENINILTQINNGNIPSDFNESLKLYSELGHRIKHHVTIVISASKDMKTQKSFDRIFIPKPTIEDLVYYAKQRLKDTPIQKISNMFNKNIAEYIEKLLATSPIILTNSILGFLFIEQFVKDVVVSLELHTKNEEKMKLANKVFRDLDHEMAALSNQLKDLQPNLEAIQVDTDTMQRNYTTKSEAVIARREIVINELNAKEHEQTTAKIAMNNHKEQIAELEPQVIKYREAVTKLTPNDVATIQITAKNPSLLTKYIFEVFCLFLNKEPSFEKEGEKLMTDPDLINILLKNVVSENLTPYAQGLFDRYFQKEEFHGKEVDEMAPAIQALFLWLRSVGTLTKLRSDLQFDIQRYATSQEDLMKTKDEYSVELAQLDQVEKLLQKDKENLEVAFNTRREMEAQYKQLDDRYQVLLRIANNHEVLRHNWEEKVKNFDQDQINTIGECLVLSYFSVIYNSIPSKDRPEIDQKVTEIVSDIFQTGNDIIETIHNKLFEKYPDSFRCSSIAAFKVAPYVSVAMRTEVAALIIDPDGFMIKSLSEVEGMVIVSQASPTFEDQILECMKNGSKLMLTDVERVTPMLLSIMSMLASKPASMNSIILQGHEAQYNPDFHLVLSSSLPLYAVPKDLLLMSIVIDCTVPSQESIKEHFRWVFMDHMKYETHIEYLRVMTENSFRYKQMVTAVQQALDTLIEPCEPSFLHCPSQIDKFCKAKDEFFKRIATNEVTVARKEYETEAEPFEKHIEIISKLWFTATRFLGLLDSQIVFNIDTFTKTVTSCLSHDGITAASTEVQIENLKTSILVGLMQSVTHSLNLKSAMLFMFKVALDIDNPKNDIESLVSTWMLKFKDPVDYNKKIILKITVPRLYSSSATDIDHALATFTKSKTYEGITNILPCFQPEQILTQSSQKPTIVFAHLANPSPIIQAFAMSRAKMEGFCVCSLTKKYSQSVIASIERAAKLGSWAIIYYIEPCPETAEIVQKAYEIAKSGSDVAFRLIVVAEDPKYIPVSFLNMAKKIVFDGTPTVRGKVAELFGRYSSSIQSSTNSTAVKRLSYCTLMNIVLTRIRSQSLVSGLSSKITTPATAYNDILKLIPLIIGTNPSQIPIENLREAIETLAYSSVSSKFDLESIRAQMDNLISNNSIEDGFSINGKQGVWSVPGDIPIASISGVISKLPILAPSSSIGVPKCNSRIRDWTASLMLVDSLKPLVTPTIPDSSLQNITKLIDVLPNCIPIDEVKKFKTPRGLFLLGEIDAVNSLLVNLKKHLLKDAKSIKMGTPTPEAIDIANDRTPDRWIGNFWINTEATLAVFMKAVASHHTQVLRWLQDGSFPIVDTRFVYNLRRLFMATLLEAAMERQEPVENLEFVFSIVANETSVVSDELVLANVYLSNAIIVDGMIAALPANAASPISIVPGIKCTVQKKLESGERTGIVIPLLEECSVAIDTKEVIGIRLPLAPDTDPAKIRAISAAFYCRVQEQLC